MVTTLTFRDRTRADRAYEALVDAGFVVQDIAATGDDAVAAHQVRVMHPADELERIEQIADRFGATHSRG